MIAAFERAYRQHFSFLMPDKTIIVEAVSVEAIAAFRGAFPGDCRWPRGREGGGAATAAMYVAGRWAERSARPAAGPARRARAWTARR